MDCGLIAANGITAIVTVAYEYQPHLRHKLPVTYAGLSDEFDGLPVNADSQLCAAINAAVNFWNDGQTVLVHCHAGRNRSVSTCVGAMVRLRHFQTVNEALQSLASKHPCSPCPRLIAHVAVLVDP